MGRLLFAFLTEVFDGFFGGSGFLIDSLFILVGLGGRRFFGLVVGVGGTALVVKKKSSGNEWQPAGFGSFA